VKAEMEMFPSLTASKKLALSAGPAGKIDVFTGQDCGIDEEAAREAYLGTSIGLRRS